jgi:hypothetical protein
MGEVGTGDALDPRRRRSVKGKNKMDVQEGK